MEKAPPVHLCGYNIPHTGDTMSNRANRRRRLHHAGMTCAHKAVDCTPIGRTKHLHGRDSTNWVTPTQVDWSKWTQARPAGTKITFGFWQDPPEWAPDQEVPYLMLAGVRVNNNSSCTDMRPASEDGKKPGNRVQDYSRIPVKHASDQMNRLSYGDVIQHGIVQERK